MKFISTPIEGLLLLEPKIFIDERGYFFESFNESEMIQHGIKGPFIQDNQSVNHKNVLRGLHFQKNPNQQGKLVRVITGSVLDIAVDIRKGSATYGQHIALELNEENKTMFYIPPGFAHGFATLRDNTIFSYKCTNVYDKTSEGCVLWNDSDLKIDWQLTDPLLSEKDLVGKKFSEFTSPF